MWRCLNIVGDHFVWYHWVPNYIWIQTEPHHLSHSWCKSVLQIPLTHQHTDADNAWDAKHVMTWKLWGTRVFHGRVHQWSYEVKWFNRSKGKKKINPFQPPPLEHSMVRKVVRQISVQSLTRGIGLHNTLERLLVGFILRITHETSNNDHQDHQILSLDMSYSTILFTITVHCS